jgi:hypothetical protein
MRYYLKSGPTIDTPVELHIIKNYLNVLLFSVFNPSTPWRNSFYFVLFCFVPSI